MSSLSWCRWEPRLLCDVRHRQTGLTGPDLPVQGQRTETELQGTVCISGNGEYTMCFRDLDKINLIRWPDFKTELIFATAPNYCHLASFTKVGSKPHDTYFRILY